MKCMKSLKKKTINPQVAASNGYTVEVFKFFWVALKEFILKSINSIFSKIKKNFLFLNVWEFYVCHEGDKHRQFFKNWRPITLLNVIHMNKKLISGCLRSRI